MKIERDDRGNLRIAREGVPGLLADLLETDVASERRACEILSALEAVRQSQPEKAPRFWGNVYELKLEAKGATISNMFDDDVPQSVLSLSEFSLALEQWLDALQRQRASGS